MKLRSGDLVLVRQEDFKGNIKSNTIEKNQTYIVVEQVKDLPVYKVELEDGTENLESCTGTCCPLS